MKNKIYFWTIIIFWTSILIFSFVSNINTAKNNNFQIVQSVGNAFFKEIVTTRLWNARHGGVYVPITEETQPNPYLMVKNRDVSIIEGGLKLTKINPAFMTRQIAEIAKRENNIQYHITSLTPIRPENKADVWEKEVLVLFENDQAGVTEFLEDEMVYRYMAPLLTKKGCLKCHSKQGYKLGDIRGGISVTIPAGLYIETIRKAKNKLIAVHLIIYLTGIVGLFLFKSIREQQIIILNKKNIKLKNEVENRKKIEKKLRIAQIEAESANRAKSDFLANMSHEIRTPMNGVIGMTSLLLGTELTDEQRDFTEIIRNSGDALLNIINDILDYSKIEAGKFDLENIDFDLRVTLDEASDLISIKAHEKELEVINVLHHDVPSFLCGDPGRLRQILINLAGNSIKFTEKGEIAIYTTLESEDKTHVTVRFGVTDTGIGIPHDRMDRLFKSFSQVDSSTTRKYGGTGLGLTISKQLAEKMGGRIGVESREGKGSTFWFTAVFEKQAEARVKKIVVPEDIKGKRILIVDDNATNRYILREQLRSWECRYKDVAGGEQALEELESALINKDPFEIAILDMQMPQMDGETLGKKIKQNPDLKNIILIMMSSMGQRGDAKILEEIGFAAYLIKPVKQSQLYNCLSTVFQNKPDKKSITPIITRHSLAEDQKHNIRILLAEDNHINQKVALNMLKKFGYSADAVANGKEAVNALEMVPYNIVLMDCQMPEMDGYDATREIRKLKSKVLNRHVPIIAMTANAMKEDRDKCLESGMNDYLSKPMKPQALSDMLEKWIAV